MHVCWHLEVKNISDDEIVRQMVGRELTNVYPPKEDTIKDDVILEVKDLCSIHERSFQHISFQLKKGEILGFGGLVGAQRTELMEAIFGMRHIESGTVEILGKRDSHQETAGCDQQLRRNDHRGSTRKRYLRMPEHR